MGVVVFTVEQPKEKLRISVGLNVVGNVWHDLSLQLNKNTTTVEKLYFHEKINIARLVSCTLSTTASKLATVTSCSFCKN